MYGWHHEIEQKSGPSGQIWVRSSHPEATNGSFRWCKGEVWENSVENIPAVHVFSHFLKKNENCWKMLKNARKIKVLLILAKCELVRCVEFWLSVAFVEIVQGLVICKTLRCWSLHAPRAVTMVDGWPRATSFAWHNFFENFKNVEKCKENQAISDLITVFKIVNHTESNVSSEIFREALRVIPCGFQVDGLPHAPSKSEHSSNSWQTFSKIWWNLDCWHP